MSGTTEDKELIRERLTSVASWEISQHRRRDTINAVATLAVDWTLLMSLVGCFLGFSTGWGTVLCGIGGALFGATVGVLYGCMVNATTAVAFDERLGHKWEADRKRAEANRLIAEHRARPESQLDLSTCPMGIATPGPSLLSQDCSHT
jgi:hypothetical protein